MAHIQYVDDLVREYLLFRGFSNTLKSFDQELKSDKDRSFRVDKIIDQIMHCINTHDLQGFREHWNHLDANLFNKLEHFFTAAVKKLEQSMLKLYLVTAHVSNKTEKITEFFNKLAVELHSQSEWREWFFFPFCKNPEDNPSFSVYFTKQWQDTLLLSLHNFLATIIQCMPQPTLTRAETEASLIRKLQEENSLLRSRIQIINSNSTQPLGSSSSSSTHQSRLSTFTEQQKTLDVVKPKILTKINVQTINDIIPFDVPPPTHIIDDFCIIAQETVTTSNVSDSQARGLKSLIRNISSGSSPVLGRKESSDRNKRRSGSATKGWIS